MKRRAFLALAGTLAIGASTSAMGRRWFVHDSDKEATMRYILQSITKNLSSEVSGNEPIGELVTTVARLFIGTPYIGGTLEGEGGEQCRVDLTGLDCVTLMENALCIARLLKRDALSYEEFIKELTFTRYRKGTITDYTSRLHYTTDWIDDNVAKGVVRDVTQELGGEPFPNTVSFMSSNPQYYPALEQNPQFIAVMKAVEDNINAKPRFFIPKDKVKKIEKSLQEGDILAITTSKAGLDCAHIGIVTFEKGQPRLLHASLTKKKVILDSAPSRYLAGVKSHSGIIVVRPLPVD